MPDEPVVDWKPETPTRDPNALGPIGWIVVAIGAVLWILRSAATLSSPRVADVPGETLGRLLSPFIIGAVVWGAIVLVTRRRTPGRRFLSGGLAITIAVLMILSTIGALTRA